MKVASPTVPIKLSPAEISSLTAGVRNAMKSFLGKKDNTPLTTQVLDEVQEKFWPSPDDTVIMDIWKATFEAAGKVVDSQPQKSVRNRPVVFSTRDGLDVVLGLDEENGELKVVSLDINPGGSAINVARALNNFGTPFELVAVKGTGPIGDLFEKTLKKEGIDTRGLLPVPQDERIHLSTVANKNEYWLVSTSPLLDESLLAKFTEQLLDACKRQEKEALAIANSPPNGASIEYVADVIERTQNDFGMFSIYDLKLHAVSRDDVIKVLEKSPGLIKPNLHEMGDLVGLDGETLRSDLPLTIHHAQELIKRYDIKMILVSMDKDGALLVDKKRAAKANAPKIKVESPGCAGDTGIAAIIDRSKKEKSSLHKLNDSEFKSILSAFVAGGAATATKPGSNLGTLEEMLELEKQVRVSFV